MSKVSPVLSSWFLAASYALGVGAASSGLCGCTRGERVDSTSLTIALIPDRLQLVNVRADSVSYQGRSAIRLTEDPGAPQVPDTPLMAIVEGTEIGEGSIELFIAGAPRLDATMGARGFVGVAFHVQERGHRAQVLYLRPTNGRADDQLRRNHATQYEALPDYPWHRLRSEQPGVYEAYVDLEPDRWTEMRIELSSRGARLFLHGNRQPTLIVNDLKTPERAGPVALWIGPEAVGYFSDLRIRAAPPGRETNGASSAP